MEHNDYFFYIVVAISVIGSIVKAIKKKPDEDAPKPRRDVGGDILRKILEEMGDKDDYIPRKPATEPEIKPVFKPAQAATTTKTARVAFDRDKKAEREYVVPEAKESHAAMTPKKGFEYVEEPVDPFLSSLDLSSADELKKAVIYSEIFRTKF